MAKRKEYAMLTRYEPCLKNGEWAERQWNARVEVMARVGLHAMVRRPGCYPFIAGISELSPIEEQPNV